jgi:hypothetical protein
MPSGCARWVFRAQEAFPHAGVRQRDRASDLRSCERTSNACTRSAIKAIGEWGRSVDLWGGGGIEAEAGLGCGALVAFGDDVVDACRVPDCGLVGGRDHTVG